MHNNHMKDYSNHIAVIGAGISGLTLGVILKSSNIPCVIFEKYDSVSEYGAGISISPNGLEVLKSLNIYNDILQMNYMCLRTVVSDICVIDTIPIAELYVKYTSGLYLQLCGEHYIRLIPRLIIH